MEKTYTIMASVLIPKVPNFLLMEDGQSLPISAVSEGELRAIGAKWIENLVQRAKEQGGKS